MSAMIDGYDVAFFDLDGVIYLGPNAVDGVPDGVAALRERGVRTVFVTNNAARPAQTVIDQLRQIGYPCEFDDIITSAQASASYLQRVLPAGSRVMVAGTQNLVDEVTNAGFVIAADADDSPDAVIQGYDPNLLWSRLDQAGYAIQEGARWFATNTDANRPTERGLVPGVGAAIDAVGSTVSFRPTIIGKPYAPMMEEAVRRTGAEHPLFVGDRLDTDIAGAVGVGMDSFLVFTGAHGKHELVRAEASERPTSIGWSVASLLEPPRVAAVSGRSATCGGATVTAQPDGTAPVEGDLGTQSAQFDALWALCQLSWSGLVTDPDAVLDRLELIP